MLDRRKKWTDWDFVRRVDTWIASQPSSQVLPEPLRNARLIDVKIPIPIAALHRGSLSIESDHLDEG